MRNFFLAKRRRVPIMKFMNKIAQVQQAMAAGDWPRAFSIASKFARLGRQRDAIMRAQAARLSPGLYEQMGHDPAAVIEAGKAAMRERFQATPSTPS
jgi:hypothetical protein